jgi:ABC-type bacteriocin/lantibiotic exporter with double-glycine peptidase domain
MIKKNILIITSVFDLLIILTPLWYYLGVSLILVSMFVYIPAMILFLVVKKHTNTKVEAVKHKRKKDLVVS